MGGTSSSGGTFKASSSLVREFDRSFLPSATDTLSGNNELESKEEKKSDTDDSKDASIRVMTYNILADGERYALGDKHDYTDEKYRVWKYRFPRILAQIEAYSPDIVCMQETTANTYSASIEASMQQLGYVGLREETRKSGGIFGGAHQDDTLFIRSNSIEIVVTSVISFSVEANKAEYKAILGDTQQYVAGLGGVAIVAQCKVKATDAVFVAVTSHFYWHPSYPHFKAAQGLLLNRAVHRLITEEWKLSIDDTPIVLGVDSNSLPIKTVTDKFDKELPKDGLVSGLYSIMTDGKLSKTHLDHPSMRIPLNVKYGLISTNALTDTIKDMSDWESPMQWKSAYREASPNNVEPIFTTKTNMFFGCLDYIFMSGPISVTAYLPLPWQNAEKDSYRRISRSEFNDIMTGDSDSETLEKRKVAIEKQMKAESERAEKLEYLPSKFHPSDHLPMVADFKLSVTCKPEE